MTSYSTTRGKVKTMHNMIYIYIYIYIYISEFRPVRQKKQYFLQPSQGGAPKAERPTKKESIGNARMES